MSLTVNHTSEGNQQFVKVSGELDAYTANQLSEKLQALTKEQGNTVIVDLSAVNYMDSTGLGVFVGALKSAKSNGSDLLLTNLTERVYRLFKITGLDEIITIQNDDIKGGAK